MKLIVCLDDMGGMAFNKRRQSRDRVQIENMRTLIGGATLAITPYSEKLLSGSGISYAVLDEPTRSDAEYCFLETVLPSDISPEAVIIYKWGRHYPSDLTFTLDMSAYRLSELTEFEGSSHEKITREIYEL